MPPAAEGPSGTCGLEFCGTACPPVQHAAFDDLPWIAYLPDPFANANGSGRVTKKADWNCRRAELFSQFQHWEVGTKPPRSSVLTGSVSATLISVTAGNGTASITWTSTVQLPTTGSPPYPAMIGLGGISLNTAAIRAMGIAIITFNNSESLR